MGNKKVYVVTGIIVTEDDETQIIEVCNNKQTALKILEDIKEEYKDFWEDFDTIENEKEILTAYNYYGCIELEIIEKEIKGED